MHTYDPQAAKLVTIGAKSRVGRGGMDAKVEACLTAGIHTYTLYTLTHTRPYYYAHTQNVTRAQTP